jgi:lactate dehydrogenase-like 2-hydroxyacid dehydrogenase
MDTILVFRTVTDDALDKLKKTFSTVHYLPDPKSEQVDDEMLKNTDAIFINWSGLPDDIVPSFSKTPRLKLIQMPSAGSERAVKAKAFQEQVQSGLQGEQEVKLCNASGIHVTSIPQWCICQAISLLHQTQKMIVYAHVSWSPGDQAVFKTDFVRPLPFSSQEKKKWGKKDMRGPFGEEGYYSRDVTGKTVGLLVRFVS